MERIWGVDEKELFEKAEDMSLSPAARSRIMHELMDHANSINDEHLWLKIGQLLVRARDKDDLSTRVSDRFVDESPDGAFKQVAMTGETRPFKAWKTRSRLLGLQ